MGYKFLFTITIVWFCYNIYKGHDPLPEFRFFAILLPIIYIVLQEGLRELYFLLTINTSDTKRFFPPVIIVLIVVCFCGQGVMLSYRVKSDSHKLKTYQMNLDLDSKKYEQIGKRLKEVSHSNASVALIDAGAISYYSGLYVIDRWGLIDTHIAHLKPKGPLGEK